MQTQSISQVMPLLPQSSQLSNSQLIYKDIYLNLLALRVL